MSIQILDDAIPEAMEYFTLHLQNPQGGKALINTDKVCILLSIKWVWPAVMSRFQKNKASYDSRFG